MERRHSPRIASQRTIDNAAGLAIALAWMLAAFLAGPLAAWMLQR